jgi:hypothetical protein
MCRRVSVRLTEWLAIVKVSAVMAPVAASL